ncbi:MAG TPA: GNAT family N-acetyltransferase [Bacteroidia bacterium]|nr:GNAT family N-acetyltransferase [Bacteroidia bacterium]
MIEVVSVNYTAKQVCAEIFSIRQKVFVEEQKVSREEEFDEYEISSLHYLGTYNSIPAGTARWRITDSGIKLERFAVLAEYRKKGIADAILKKVLSHVRPSGAKIYLNAQVTAIGFYEKNGFKKEGSMFSEANIDHFKMSFIKY